ncbi:MAG: DUF6429 family protein [Novosphingobium sp.]|nr:DUF6429 family protein [Novosphingobium sp.]
MERLHERGLISHLAGKAKSVQLTAEGLVEEQRLVREQFGRRPSTWNEGPSYAFRYRHRRDWLSGGSQCLQ